MSRGLRIIAGSHKGRRVRVPVAAAVRPTPERVREALFSMLGPSVQGAVVLDAFAGSGALGFEALSRGAARVVFIESDTGVVAALRTNVTLLGMDDACEVVEGEVLPALARGGRWGRFEVVLADPPYAITTEKRERTLEALAAVMGAGGLLVWERTTRSDVVRVPGLDFRESRRYGNTTLDLYDGVDNGPPSGAVGGLDNPS